MVQNNKEEGVRIQLEEGEIMRISIRKTETGEFEVLGRFEGEKSIMRAGILQICKQYFDMVCIPEKVYVEGDTRIPIDFGVRVFPNAKKEISE